MAAVVALGVSAPAAWADGEFWAFDFSESSSSGVLSVSRGVYSYGFSVTDYGDGVAASVGLSRRLPFDLGVPGLAFGAGPAISLGGGDLSEPSLGLSASAQRFVTTDWGSYFLQASVGSTSRSYFTQAQVTFAEPKLSVALSRGASTQYESTSVTVSRRLGEGPVSLRAGYRFEAEEIFLGFSVNTF